MSPFYSPFKPHPHSSRGYLIAVVANFFVGFVWYTPLFGKAWAKEMKIEVTRKPTAAEIGKGMSMMIIGNFLMAWVFAHTIAQDRPHALNAAVVQPAR